MSRVFYSVLILGTLLVHDALAIKCGYMSMRCQRMAVRAAVPMDSRDLVVRYVDVRCWKCFSMQSV